MIRVVHSLARRVAVVLLAIMAFGRPAAAENEIQLLTEYFDLLVSGNYESASYLWLETCQDRSAKFGISYDDIPLKIDCASPIVRDLKVMKNHLQPPVKKVRHLSDDGYSVLEFSTVVYGNLVSHDYYAYNDSNHCWLIYPQDYYCRDWPVYETRYFRLNVHPDIVEQLNDIALAQADQFVEETARVLEITDDDLELLRQKKIDYFFCDSDYRVKNITGFLVKGTYDLPSDDVISAFFPHYHELSHLLVNFRLRKLPLYTMPILREGIAVHLGGRWGKAPASLEALGGYLYREKIVEIDSMLTMTGFEQQVGSGIAYPVAGLFTGYLVEVLGVNGFFRLYMDLSGKFDALTAMARADTKKAILKAVGESDWEKFLSDFNRYVNTRLDEQADIQPGRLDKGKVVLEIDDVRITEEGDWLSVEFSSGDSTAPAGNILFAKESALAATRSPLFEGQYPGETPYEGYRYGIRMDKNEAGVYDYATNTLMAKYIWGISPSEEYFDAQKNRIAIKVKKTLLNPYLPSADDCRVMPD